MQVRSGTASGLWVYFFAAVPKTTPCCVEYSTDTIAPIESHQILPRPQTLWRSESAELSFPFFVFKAPMTLRRSGDESLNRNWRCDFQFVREAG
ncbi:hypothetical protein NQZ68_007989 [Dissostichus eleginoides]|nr:hypothetical protein NQZ68_007989 [Dissostichus eleginoides]